MLILYTRTGCYFCQEVLDEAEKMHITIELRNIGEERWAQQLIARGGKRKVPYLVDEVNHVEMYESDNIVEYLHHNLGIPTL